MSTDQLLKDAKDRAYEYWATSNSGPTWAKALDRAVELGAEAMRKHGVGIGEEEDDPVLYAETVEDGDRAAHVYGELRARVEELGGEVAIWHRMSDVIDEQHGEGWLQMIAIGAARAHLAANVEL